MVDGAVAQGLFGEAAHVARGAFAQRSLVDRSQLSPSLIAQRSDGLEKLPQGLRLIGVGAHEFHAVKTPHSEGARRDDSARAGRVVEERHLSE